ncbi:MAG: hypothetical protein ABSB95_16335 [Dissulfurispiraceae bacterium]|jgi:hypothetical protein
MTEIFQLHHRPEWSGSEVTRLLFDTLVGTPGKSDGILGDALVYRGINLPRLFEGTWITLIWPRWFQELAVLDEIAAKHTGSVVLCGEADAARERAAQCVMARHPGVRMEFRPSLPVASRLCALVRDGRLFQMLSMIKRFFRILRWGAASPVGKTADLAFFPWSAKIAPSILPVADAAAGQGRMSACVAGWETAPPFDLNDDWEWDTLASVRSPRILLEAWRAAGELRRRWSALLREKRLDSLGQWNGWDMRPLAFPFLETTVNQFFPLLANILTVEEWCKRRRLRGIVVPQDGGEGVRSLIAGASLAGVRSFSLQYGYPMDGPEISEPMEDLALLSGEFTKRFFLQRGVSPDKLAVVGTTIYDRVARLRSDRSRLRAELANRYNLDPNRPWLVVATWHVQAMYPKHVKEAELALIMEAASRCPHLQVLFKLHPSDQDEGKFEAAAAERFGIDSRIIGNVAENETLLCSADAVVCNYTTLAIMAIVAKTPVIIVDLDGTQQAPNRAYVDEGVAEYANTPASAEAALRSILDTSKDSYWECRNESWRRFIVERLHKDDGQAAVRILQTIEARLEGGDDL